MMNKNIKGTSIIEGMMMDMAYIYGKWAVNYFDTTPDLDENLAECKRQYCKQVKEEFYKKFKHDIEEIYGNDDIKPWTKQ